MLRLIADDIEHGEYDFPISTCVVLLAHADNEHEQDGIMVEPYYYESHACGPRADVFTVRGVVSTILLKMGVLQ